MAHTAAHSGGNTSHASVTHSTSGHSGGMNSSMAHSTTKMSDDTGTTSAAAGATKKAEGKVSFKVGTLKQCQDLAASTKFGEKLCEEIIKMMGLPSSFPTSKCVQRRSNGISFIFRICLLLKMTYSGPSPGFSLIE